MKRKLFFAATAATLLFTGCANDEYVGEVENPRGELTEITFASKNAGITRAELSGSAAAGLLGGNFVVVGYKNVSGESSSSVKVFDHYNVNYKVGTANSTLSNTANWEYVGQDMKVRGTDPEKSLATGVTEQTIKYWDHSASSYDFVAFSMGQGYSTGEPEQTTYATPTAVQWNQLTSPAYTLSGDINTLSECYISDKKTVQETEYSNSAVQLQFRHLTSKIRMALYETVPGYKIKDVRFHQSAQDTHTTATEKKPTLFGSNAFNKKGTYTVSFSENEGKANLSFSAEATDGTENVLQFTQVNYKESFLGETSADASYCGTGTDDKEFKKILPNGGNGNVVSMQIDYTLYSEDGSREEIKVYGAKADVPAAYTAWKPGYAYTYIFKISQNTNGHTGSSVDDKGLTAISFDAIVLDDEATGQETITTVSNPSITTFGVNTNNVITKDGDEYEVGTTIYATAYIPASGITGQEGYIPAKTDAPQNLYTVTIENGACQTINEYSVANAIKNGSMSAESPTTYTLTDANGKNLIVKQVSTNDANIVTSVPSEDGGTRSVNALKWNAENAGTIYAVEYETTTNDKVYKIVRIKSN